MASDRSREGPRAADRPAAVTRILRGEPGPHRAEELLPLVYDELRALARARVAREAPGQTIHATVLVHEAYLRLVGGGDPGWNGRGHFFGAAALAMRRILVEQARRRARLKRGGGRERVEVGEAEEADGLELLPGAPASPSTDVLAVEEALARLEREDSRKGRIVELRYFAGLSVEETAQALGLSVGTIEREWRFIRAWLQVELDEGE
jgi:RNA polymerase sigma factor (TIGR02999 family)